ncbi:hypothetical protein LAC81_37265 (plasmid) [Ensifer adhaerens]|uniref:hypothetical protein n=1 Tax=Ensifer adhaerens TaxID=106592 RepID=UPI001CC01490|nr:hypothetical protein [Ensifer adhaerens]MBZ7927591.1 hypothetical protein [Ensifer adhaerens]UAX97998.1 hypothetical protein LAC78_38570 [Ensifer adhaerens]UAY05378.1 hypothetical protein LAC80_37280 [Ensifer adhaerens]UAY12756.1 hypothetical protein LAC81_37265 [Ensifer adhaerens]
MKTPQRKFVVEFKSGRRQPKNGANSIWGDTDFKALAREVEDQSSHLFGTAETTVPEVTDPKAQTGAQIPAGAPVVEAVAPEMLTNPLSAGSTEPPASPPVVIAAVAEPTAAPVEPLTVSKIDQVADPEQAPIELPTVSKIAKSPKKAPRKRVARVLPGAAKDDPQVLPAEPVTAPIDADDLDTLDAENKRLRLLLANQLRAQNAQLKRMLERF